MVGFVNDSITTTEEVAEAAGVHPTTINRWVRAGLLPAPEVFYRGRRGKQSRWDHVAPTQARWVARLLKLGLTFDEIRAKLAAGEFRPFR
jgi:DNA-binding transcriptional MerR regulator